MKITTDQSKYPLVSARLMPPPLTDLSCKYGAPMGRRDTDTETHLPHKFYLSRLTLIDDCYDQGGAYWGMPCNLYRAWAPGHDEPQEIFRRANSRQEAKLLVLKTFPLATFHR